MRFRFDSLIFKQAPKLDYFPEYVYRHIEEQYVTTKTLGSGNNQATLNKTKSKGCLMTKKAQFKIDGLLKLEKVGDYLNLVGKKVKLVFKEKDSALNTKSFFKADIAGLSETGTHLVLKNVTARKYIFFSTQIKKRIVPINNISTIQILGE